MTIGLRVEQNATMPTSAPLLLQPQPIQTWCGPEMGGWCPDNIATSREGAASFHELRINTIGAGVFFEVTVEGLPGLAHRTNQTYSVTLGAPALLRFAISPGDDNLQDMYFDRQPIVQVTDLGGNCVEDGVHQITLDLAEGDGRLRGPKVRYTRRGEVRFDRLRVAAPGYDKMMRAVASGLAARPLRRRGRLARRRGDERRLERRERARLGLGLGRRGGAAEVYLLAEALVAGELLGDAHGRAAQAPREEGSECGAVF